MIASMAVPPLATAVRIERALVLLAYCIELDGDVHVPLYERLEAELLKITRIEDTKARARRLLSDYGRAGSLKAISFNKLGFSAINSGSEVTLFGITP